jgi:hypothetical protein
LGEATKRPTSGLSGEGRVVMSQGRGHAPGACGPRHSDSDGYGA